MGVKVRKRRGKWYVFIDWKGKRRARCIGVSREAAEDVRREIERRLSLGTFNMPEEIHAPTFEEYAKHWLSSHVRPNLKLSTVQSYEAILNFHLLPAFGKVRLDTVTRYRVKSYLAELSRTEGRARNTVRNVLAALRAMLNYAVEDGVIDRNPATRLGRFNLTKGRGQRADFLTREEAEAFLQAAKNFCPERYPLFLMALRAGLRLGELLALQWDDIHFGASQDDEDRYIMVRRNFVRGHPTTPKNRKARRVDLSRELRRVLIELQSQRDLIASKCKATDGHGQPNISKLVFPSGTGGPLHGSNLNRRDFLPCLKTAGLRRVNFHALRHTFASLLIQNGASLAYVKEQMGHSSIQVTVDTYGHLIPGGNIGWVDALDGKASPQQSATLAQPTRRRPVKNRRQVIENNGRPGGIRTPDPRFRKYFRPNLLTC
jgi:integrase